MPKLSSSISDMISGIVLFSFLSFSKSVFRSFLSKNGFVDYALEVTVAAVTEDKVDEVKRWISSHDLKHAFISPLEDEMYCLSLVNFLDIAKKEENYAVNMFDMIKKKVITFPDPKPVELNWENHLKTENASKISPRFNI